MPKRGSAKIITPAADCSRWAQVRTADDQEEGVLHLAVQPDDPGQPAEHLALAAFPQDGRVAAAGGGGIAAHAGIHLGRVCAEARHRGAPAQFQMNWAALMT